MAYSKLLLKIIVESGYSYKEIIEECNKRGKKIDKSYFSRLVNGKVPPPSEELSRMISNICEVDERLLVLEGYIEKAPKEIREVFQNMKNLILSFSASFIDDEYSEENIKNVKGILDKEPLADFIISLLDMDMNNIDFNNDDYYIKNKQDEDFTITLKEPIALSVKDNAMYPIIPEGAKIYLKYIEDYENGEYFAIKMNKENDYIVRQVLVNNEKIILVPLNKSFETKTYNKEELTILGKIDKVLTKI